MFSNFVLLIFYQPFSSLVHMFFTYYPFLYSPFFFLFLCGHTHLIPLMAFEAVKCTAKLVRCH